MHGGLNAPSLPTADCCSLKMLKQISQRSREEKLPPDAVLSGTSQQIQGKLAKASRILTIGGHGFEVQGRFSSQDQI